MIQGGFTKTRYGGTGADLIGSSMITTSMPLKFEKLDLRHAISTGTNLGQKNK